MFGYFDRGIKTFGDAKFLESFVKSVAGLTSRGLAVCAAAWLSCLPCTLTGAARTSVRMPCSPCTVPQRSGSRRRLLIKRVETVVSGCDVMSTHMKISFFSCSVYEIIYLSDAFWLHVNKIISWLFHADFDTCSKTDKQISIIYVHTFILISLAIRIYFSYFHELWLQSIHSLFAVSENFYSLLYITYASSAPLTGVLEILNLQSKNF